MVSNPIHHPRPLFAAVEVATEAAAMDSPTQASSANASAKPSFASALRAAGGGQVRRGR